MPRNTSRVMLRANSTELVIGEIPRVIGTLSEFSQGTPRKNREFPCDIVEVRLDQIANQTNWLEQCQQIEASGTPVILTIRHQAEGGAWVEPEQRRLKLLEQALAHLSCIDVEFKSEIAFSVSQMAKGLNKACIVSFHDFEKTANFEELLSLVREAEKLGSIVKISTMIKGEKDLETLAALLNSPRNTPLCVIGMGSQGTHTRISFATLGSCFTYGYLDRPMAPGQISALNLVEALRKTLPKYNDDFISRKQSRQNCPID